MATAVACAWSAGATGVGMLLLPLLGRFYLGTDLTHVDLGTVCELQDRLRHLDGVWLAAWLGLGEPLFANPQTQLLFPIRWLVLVLPPDWAVSVGVALQLSVAAAGASWLARTFGVGVRVSISAGLVYAFSGVVLSQVEHSTYLAGASLLPVTWAAGRRMLQRPVGLVPRLGVLAGSLGCLLAADPQAYAMGLGVLGLEGLLRWAAGRHHARPRLVRLMCWLGGALFISMVQWLPALAEMALTSRATRFGLEAALAWSFTPLEWLGSVLPGIVQERLHGDQSLWSTFHPHVTMPWIPSAYLGPLALALAAAGWWRRNTRAALIAGGFGLLLSVGDATPLFALLWQWVPGFQFFRYPAKYVVIVNAAVVIVMAVSVQHGLRSARGQRLLLVACVTGVVGMGLAAVLTGSALLDAVLGPADASASSLPFLDSALLHALTHACLPLLCGVVVLAHAGRLKQLLPWLVVADLGAAAPMVLHVGPPVAPLPSPLGNLAPSPSQPAVVCHDQSLVGLQFNLPDELGPWSQVALMRALSMPELNACEGVVSGVSYSLLQSGMNRALSSELSGGRMAAARALGCTHLVLARPLADEAAQPVPQPDFLTRNGIFVYPVEHPIPRAFHAVGPALLDGERVVPALRQAHTAADALRVVDDPLGRLPNETRLPDGAGVTEVEVHGSAPHRSTVEARGTGPAVVGLRTAFHVGWRAFQAERELPVIRVAGSHVAAQVERVEDGPVVFEYFPPRLAWGLLCLLLGLGVLMVEFRTRPRV